jgi:DNA polymerase-3 subunit epsilon
MLQLTRPIAFIDLETTGVSLSTDRIVEIAIIKLLPDGSRQVKRKLINPQIPIPKVSSDIHGISNEMVKDAPTFKQVANEVKMYLEGCDLGGYNSNRFDIPMLMEEFLRAGMDVDLSKRKMVDVQHIFYTMEPRTLTAAYKFFCEKELIDAHSAEADVNATIDVFLAQLKMWLLGQSEVGARLMSGSGSTMFAVMREKADAVSVATRAKAKLDPELWTCTCKTL